MVLHVESNGVKHTAIFQDPRQGNSGRCWFSVSLCLFICNGWPRVWKGKSYLLQFALELFRILLPSELIRSSWPQLLTAFQEQHEGPQLKANIAGGKIPPFICSYVILCTGSYLGDSLNVEHLASHNLSTTACSLNMGLVRAKSCLLNNELVLYLIQTIGPLSPMLSILIGSAASPSSQTKAFGSMCNQRPL